MIRWYEWGNEDPGNVSIWILAKDGEVISLGQMAKDKLPKEAIKDCPYH